MTEHQWSEWFEHTPGPCPVPVGTWVETVSLFPDGSTVTRKRRAMLSRGGSWLAPYPGWVTPWGSCVAQTIRYRYRISKHLIEMRQKAADLTPIKSPEVVQ